MYTKATVVASAAATVALLLPGLAQAQRSVNVGGIQPYYQVAPGLNLQQAGFNTMFMGRAIGAVPPYAMGFAPSYALGYNPAANVNYYGPNFNPYLYSPFLPPSGFNPALNPYAVNPYASAAMSTANPYLYGGTGGTATMTSTGALPNGGYDTASLAANSAYSPYSNPYSGYYAPDPNTGYMRGAAEVINSQAHFRLSTEQARLIQQQVARERLENRRRWVDEYNYEREHMPTAEDDRQRSMRIYLSRSQNEPPVTEILSAAPLNSLLDYLEKHIDHTATATQVPLDEDVLRRVNVTVPQGGNIGLLKGLNADGKLSWPVALRGDAFQKDREKIDSLVPDAIELAKKGRADAGALGEVRNSIERMRQQLSIDLRDMTPAQGIEARRYLSNLDDAVRALERPDAGNLLTREWTARGNNVADLVKTMKEKGLVFAPSVGGDEAAYLALHRALASYTSALTASLEARQNRQAPAPEKDK